MCKTYTVTKMIERSRLIDNSGTSSPVATAASAVRAAAAGQAGAAGQIVVATSAAAGTPVAVAGPAGGPAGSTQINLKIVFVRILDLAICLNVKLFTGDCAAGAGMTRHIVMTHGGAAGGTPVRSGQILQVTGQGGQQHQIVVSQSGQIILNPNTAGMVMLLS